MQEYYTRINICISVKIRTIITAQTKIKVAKNQHLLQQKFINLDYFKILKKPFTTCILIVYNIFQKFNRM